MIPDKILSNFEEIGRHHQDHYEADTGESPMTHAAIMMMAQSLHDHADDFEDMGGGQVIYSGGGDSGNPIPEDEDDDEDKITFTMSDDPSEVSLND
jgi:hypothetical protein